MHLCAGLTAASWILDPFGEIGDNFSLQLSSRPQFAKISNKKVIAENQCEKDFTSLQQNIVAHIKETKSVTMNIFRKIFFSF